MISSIKDNHVDIIYSLCPIDLKPKYLVIYSKILDITVIEKHYQIRLF